MTLSSYCFCTVQLLLQPLPDTTACTAHCTAGPQLEVWARGPNQQAAGSTEGPRQHLSESEQLELRSLCGRTLYHTLQGSVHMYTPQGAPHAFVATGDIPDQWIRDSSVQMGVLLPRIAQHPTLRQVRPGTSVMTARPLWCCGQLLWCWPAAVVLWPAAVVLWPAAVVLASCCGAVASCCGAVASCCGAVASCCGAGASCCGAVASCCGAGQLLWCWGQLLWCWPAAVVLASCCGAGQPLWCWPAAVACQCTLRQVRPGAGAAGTNAVGLIICCAMLCHAVPCCAMLCHAGS